MKLTNPSIESDYTFEVFVPSGVEFYLFVGQWVMEHEFKAVQWFNGRLLVKAKHHYEAVCRVLGVPAYATWNED
jgi:hypothetical protein